MTSTYTEALDYVYGFINYEVTRHYRYSPDVISLKRPRQLLALLGDPQDSYPTLHIAGTKGKGSVSAYCASIYNAAGLKTGLYTSPHLQDFRERFRINGDLIAEGRFAALVDSARSAIAEIEDITFFEVITALAFLYFAEENVDVAVIEVGLGGRLDATNVITPHVSLITSLSYDHMYLLGDTLSEIAFEKGGIIKPGVPVVSAPQPDEAREILEEIGEERGAPLTLVGRDWTYEPLEADTRSQTFRAGPAGGPADVYEIPLLGDHQVMNAAVALAGVDRAGIPVARNAVKHGLRDTDWPGRLEVVGRKPWLVLDSAHNAESAERLRAALDELFPHERQILIFGASADKNFKGMFDALLPHTDLLILSQADHPRAIAPENLAEYAEPYDCEIALVPDLSEALNHARRAANLDDLICAAGSIFVVGELRTALNLLLGRSVKPDDV